MCSVESVCAVGVLSVLDPCLRVSERGGLIMSVLSIYTGGGGFTWGPGLGLRRSPGWLRGV